MYETCLMLTLEGFLSDYYRTSNLSKFNRAFLYNNFLENTYQRLNLLFQKYLQILILNGSKCEFLLPYVSMAETLHTLIRVSKEGNFPLHLESVEITAQTGLPMIELITQGRSNFTSIDDFTISLKN